LAHSWPSTIFSPLCETFAYLDKASSIGVDRVENQHKNVGNEDSWSFLDALVNKGGIPVLDDWVGDTNYTNGDSNDYSSWGYANSMKLAIQTSFTPNTLDQNLLPLALALRVYAPTCEMHRTLARDAAISFGLYHRQQSTLPPAAFAVISRVAHPNENRNQTVVIGTRVVVEESLVEDALEMLEGLSNSTTQEDDVDKADGEETSTTTQDDDTKDSNDEETSTTTPPTIPEQSPLLLPLPGETFYPEILKPPIDYTDPDWRAELAKWNRVRDETIAILYGQVGTSAFARLYNSLKEKKIKFVVRHMGHVAYEEESNNHHGSAGGESESSSRAIPTALQGYGVRLDIRNVEYKAFDDGPKDKANDDELNFDWNDVGHDPQSPVRDEYLAGVNLHTLMKRFNEQSPEDATPLSDDIQALQTALLQSHPAQLSSESIVPPAWKRRSLSLQAATAIIDSSDPLTTLQGLSQNLPSVAHALSSIHVNDSLKSFAQEATDLSEKVGAVSPGWGDAPFGFYINSREVDIERPSFNVFQLLDVIREEDVKLRDLEKGLRPVLERTFGVLMGEGRGKGTAFKVLQDVRRGMDMGLERLVEFGEKKGDVAVEEERDEDDPLDEGDKKYRIDVGRGGKNAVLYLNDLEKDPEYQSWPSVEEMMMRMQFGQGPATRRNLFTMLIVVDPASGKGVHPALNILTQLVNGQFPVRIGLLIVSHDDLAAKEVSEPGPFDNGNRPFHSSDALAILRHISKKYGGMAAISALVNVFQPQNGKMLTVKEYINSYVSLLVQMGVIAAEKENFIRQEIQLLLTFPEADDTMYKKAFGFATKKFLKPGKTSLLSISRHMHVQLSINHLFYDV
jgi:hypothetical protein